MEARGLVSRPNGMLSHLWLTFQKDTITVPVRSISTKSNATLVRPMYSTWLVTKNLFVSNGTLTEDPSFWQCFGEMC